MMYKSMIGAKLLFLKSYVIRFNLQAHDRLKLSINTDGRIVLYKSDFFDDVEDLIRKDLESEGLSAEQIEKKLPERKKELGKALLKMASEVDQEIERGEYITLDQLNDELEDEHYHMYEVIIPKSVIKEIKKGRKAGSSKGKKSNRRYFGKSLPW